MITRFCPRCRREVRVREGGSSLHTCQRAARHDEDTQPITTGELAGPSDAGALSGARTREVPEC